MFRNRYRLCELAGIPVYLDFSLLILLFLFAMQGGSLAYSVPCAVLLLASVVLHELGHALTARAFGYRTSDITLSLLGGCARIINLASCSGWHEFLVALAGPAVSFALAGAAYFAWPIFPVKDSWTFEMFNYFFLMNLMLGAFNLLPGFPMDGGRIFRSALLAFASRANATRIAMVVGRVTAVALGFWGLHRVFSGGAFGFVTMLIAWMVWREGAREYRQVVEEENWRRGCYARVSPPPWGGDSTTVGFD